MDKEGHAQTSVAADILAALYPVLLIAARAELKARGGDLKLADEIAHAAAQRYLELVVEPTEKAAKRYMTNYIRRAVRNIGRLTADASSRADSLDAPYPEQIEEL